MVSAKALSYESPHTANRRRQLGLVQALGVPHGEKLHTPVAVVDQPVFGAGPAGMDRLLQSIDHEADGGAGADLPPDDPPAARYRSARSAAARCGSTNRVRSCFGCRLTAQTAGNAGWIA